MKRTFLLLSICLLVSISTFGQTKLTENTLRINKDAIGAIGKPSIMDWMIGSWEGEALGGSVREIWTNPGGGAMIGMFSLVKDGKPIFYEFLTFTAEKDILLLKLKHFHPNLVSWEEKEKTTDFRFIKQEANRFYFSGLTFEKVGNDQLHIFLALTRDGKTHEEFFKMTRLN